MQKTEKSAKVQRRDKLKGRIEQVIKEIYGSIEFGMPAKFARSIDVEGKDVNMWLNKQRSNQPSDKDLKKIEEVHGYAFEWLRNGTGPEKIGKEVVVEQRDTEEALRAELKKKDCELIELKAELRVCERVIDRLIAKLTMKNKGDYKGIIGEAVKNSRAAKDPH
jgi:hypothetical protein